MDIELDKIKSIKIDEMWFQDVSIAITKQEWV